MTVVNADRPSTLLVSMSSSELADVLHMMLRLGTMLSRAGAASFRVDQAMRRTALAMGVDRVETFVTPTGIIASIYSNQEFRTQIVRLTGLGVDMNRITLLELLTRDIYRHLGLATPQEITKRLDEIEAIPAQYPHWMVCLAVGLACGAFAMIVGGGLFEALAAFSGAFLAQFVRFWMNKQQYTPVVVTVGAAIVATAVSSLAIGVIQPLVVQLGGPTLLPRTAVVASVLLLVPGVPFVTSLLDIIRFDLVAGTARAVYAIVILTCIAIGMLAVLSITGFSII